MSNWTIGSSQCTVNPRDLGKPYDEALADLKEEVAYELKRAKKFFGGRAVKIKLTERAYRIAATRDPQSALWIELFLVKIE